MAFKLCQQDKDGWVLGAQLGKELEGRLGHKLPVRLRPELEKYPAAFETKDSPAFSVRIRNSEAKATGIPRVRDGGKLTEGWPMNG